MRQCGTCSACCRWPSIPALSKPAREPCKHLCGGKYGCEIYETRPDACADYECTWIKGFGADEDQPVYSHVLIDMRETAWGTVLAAKPLRPGACMTTKGKAAIQRIAKDRDVLCLVMDDEPSQTVIGVAGPKHLVDAFRKEHGDRPTRMKAAKSPLQAAGLDINQIVRDAMKVHEEYVAGAV